MTTAKSVYALEIQLDKEELDVITSMVFYSLSFLSMKSENDKEEQEEVSKIRDLAHRLGIEQDIDWS